MRRCSEDAHIRFLLTDVFIVVQSDAFDAQHGMIVIEEPEQDDGEGVFIGLTIWQGTTDNFGGHVVHHATDTKIFAVRGDVVTIADHDISIGHIDSKAAFIQILIAQAIAVQDLEGSDNIQRGGDKREPAMPCDFGDLAIGTFFRPRRILDIFS